MRLTENNIKFVKQMTVNGTTRKYAVILKSNYVSDIKIFTEYDTFKFLKKLFIFRLTSINLYDIIQSNFMG